MRVFTGPKLDLDVLVFSPDGRHLAASARKAEQSTVVWAVAGSGRPRRVGLPTALRLSFDAIGERLLIKPGWLWCDLGTRETHTDDGLTALDAFAVVSGARVVSTLKSSPSDGVLRLGIARPAADGWEQVWAHTVHYDPAPADVPLNLHAQYRHGQFGVFFNPDATRLYRLHRVGPFVSNMVATEVQAFDTATGETVAEWRGDLPDEGYPSFAGPSGAVVVINKRSLHVIDTTTPNSSPSKHSSSSPKHFTAAAFSPNGKLLATTSNDTTVTLWDTATWQPIRQYAWEIGRLRAVAFAPDGLTCAAGSDTGKVVLFDVD